MDQKKEVYLLDTNAYFNFLRYATKALGDDDTFNETIEKIRDAECYISQVSLLEIISVLGKYSRGNSGGKEKCNCIIDEHGTICPNFKYTTKKNKWSKKRKKAWIKYFEEMKQGTSDILSIHVLPLDAITWAEAEKIIMLSPSRWASLRRTEIPSGTLGPSLGNLSRTKFTSGRPKSERLRLLELEAPRPRERSTPPGSPATLSPVKTTSMKLHTAASRSRGRRSAPSPTAGWATWT